jgi:aryl-alcohol dehydrogenase-like predicted oxidoreductase
METRRLGLSDLMITPLGVGAWAMGGGGWQFGWGPQDDAQSIGAIRAALAAGWNWIDTAAVYGLGRSEEVVARALDGVSPRPLVFTKCSRCWDEKGQIFGSLKKESIRAECEASLRRLRVDAIDLYQIHRPEPDEDLEEAWGAMARLKEEGKIRWLGLSNADESQIARVERIAPVTSLQPPYSIISPEAETDLLPYCAANAIGVISYSPMKLGLLSGKMTRERVAAMPPDDYRRSLPHFREPKLSRNLALAEKLREIGARRGKTPGEVAIAWCLRNPAVTGAIVGLRSAEQLTGVTGAADFRLSGREVAEIALFMSENPA